ncbi:MAG: hypothetical protein HC809_12695 [Gammaproteobacteria bacterium]|nr:hypothetical protein [Gammaproteobacteria bacterium]
MSFGLIGVALLLGCDGESQAATGGSGGSSPDKAAAAQAVMSELAAHWSQGSDGWSSVREIGSRYVPQRVVRQMKTLEIARVRVLDVSEADRMNGVEWAGEAEFKDTPCRGDRPRRPAFEEQLSMDGAVGAMRGVGRRGPSAWATR